MTTGVIHQPHFLPWLGYFNKLYNCDLYIVQDNVQYRARYFQNRTLICSPQRKPQWFTIPVNYRRSTIIKDVTIADVKWSSNLIKNLKYGYSHEPFFAENFEIISSIISSTSGMKFLIDVNVELLASITELLDIPLDIKYAHNFEKQKNATLDLIYLCKENKVEQYIFGEGGGLKYHGINQFKDNKIKTISQNFYSKFVSINSNIYPDSNHMSVLHYLFKIGKMETKKIISETWVKNKD